MECVRARSQLFCQSLYSSPLLLFESKNSVSSSIISAQPDLSIVGAAYPKSLNFLKTDGTLARVEKNAIGTKILES
ncbi:MAG TPA: hypothetical protein V6D14_13145 [Coleofasciculaceae cyanobacterium]